MKNILFIITLLISKISFASFPVENYIKEVDKPFEMEFGDIFLYIILFSIWYFLRWRYRKFNHIEDESKRVRKKTIFFIIIILGVIGMLALAMSALSV